MLHLMCIQRMLDIEVLPFRTHPAVVHAQGYQPYKPHWAPIRDAYYATPASRETLPPDLTIVTCNNGHPAMGCFERSLRHMGLECGVLGHGVSPWINSRDKPDLIARAARRCVTGFILYADSRDALLIQPPQLLLGRFKACFNCDLLFGADRLSYPPNPTWKSFEDNLAGAAHSDFKYLNAGTWIGRTQFVAEFFEKASRWKPFSSAPESEQGIIRDLLPWAGSRVAIDYRCDIFLNVGFLVGHRIRIHEAQGHPK
jgi:hypothetical protein